MVEKRNEVFEVVEGNVHMVSNSQPPASNLEARENQMINLAVNLAEKQLTEGTASSAVICHYLKLATKTEKIRAQLMQEQATLFSAKVESIEASKSSEKMYLNAIEAMKSYG